MNLPQNLPRLVAVIAIAWIAYRPLIAIAVLAAGVALATGILYLRRGKAAATAPALGRA